MVADFTFHNVSINTVAYGMAETAPISVFTFHNVSINTVLSAEIIKAMCLFTFHNVSINTETMQVLTVIHSTLHSTMFLLIRLSRTRQDLLLMSLHSTMFLLILR